MAFSEWAPRALVGHAAGGLTEPTTQAVATVTAHTSWAAIKIVHKSDADKGCRVYSSKFREMVVSYRIGDVKGASSTFAFGIPDTQLVPWFICMPNVSFG
jgi:hypothetical protein